MLYALSLLSSFVAAAPTAVPLSHPAESVAGPITRHVAEPALAAPEDAPPPVAPASVKRTMKLRKLAAKTLATPLPSGLGEQDEVRALVRRAVAASVALGESSYIGAELKAASKEAIRNLDTQPRAAALLVELTTNSAVKNLGFEPILEAALPAGFPYPAPAGEIQIAEYPQYRLARSAMGGRSQNGAFFTLFRHIQSNEIAMTAPVEMTMDEGGAVDMAFLYGDPGIGEAGQDGRVAVQDIEPMTVVTIGVRGSSRSAAIQSALTELEGWLKQNSDTWERKGNARLMGYNSPMVPRRKQFSEVQIPIQRVED